MSESKKKPKEYKVTNWGVPNDHENAPIIFNKRKKLINFLLENHPEIFSWRFKYSKSDGTGEFKTRAYFYSNSLEFMQLQKEQCRNQCDEENYGSKKLTPNAIELIKKYCQEHPIDSSLCVREQPSQSSDDGGGEEKHVPRPPTPESISEPLTWPESPEKIYEELLKKRRVDIDWINQTAQWRIKSPNILKNTLEKYETCSDEEYQNFLGENSKNGNLKRVLASDHIKLKFISQMQPLLSMMNYHELFKIIPLWAFNSSEEQGQIHDNEKIYHCLIDNAHKPINFDINKMSTFRDKILICYYSALIEIIIKNFKNIFVKFNKKTKTEEGYDTLLKTLCKFIKEKASGDLPEDEQEHVHSFSHFFGDIVNTVNILLKNYFNNSEGVWRHTYLMFERYSSRTPQKINIENNFLRIFKIHLLAIVKVLTENKTGKGYHGKIMDQNGQYVYTEDRIGLSYYPNDITDFPRFSYINPNMMSTGVYLSNYFTFKIYKDTEKQLSQALWLSDETINRLLSHFCEKKKRKIKGGYISKKKKLTKKRKFKKKRKLTKKRKFKKKRR
tara:strand:- start:4624 stop:6294 length:1671 start_codon:yes stop_codon:yes gene_type:complete